METFNPLYTFVLMYMNLRKSDNWKKAKIVICAAYKKISSSAWLQDVNPFENIFMTGGAGGIKSGKTDLTLLFSTYLRVRSLISL